MSLPPILLAAAFAAATSPATPERVATRCRPGPYIVAQRGPPPALTRLILPPRVDGVGEKRTRPCYLTRSGTDAPPLRPQARGWAAE